ncbi:MAG: hypothetical protein LBG11_11950 [Bifidobacteriaceae bacterium]|nr:hypothetical protein [Bifidobacteriaceae bacterium]
MFSELARLETVLAATYRDRVQYELLQNSDDAGATSVNVQIRSDGLVSWSNNGRPFDRADAEGLCRSASSTKIRGESIGYRGIGFKALAAVASRVKVESARTSFTFDREEAARLLAAAGDSVDRRSVPLTRIPTQVARSDVNVGASFTITPNNQVEDRQILGAINPLSLLFLRNLRELNIETPNTSVTFALERNADRLVLSVDRRTAEFAVLQDAKATIAVPLNDMALSLTTIRGRLACFLPVDDALGVPLVISGDFLTDPSRTHAVLGDPSTQTVLENAAGAFAAVLSNPQHHWFERAWTLMIQAEDPRSILASGGGSTDFVFLSRLRDHLAIASLPFTISPIPLQREELRHLFPNGADAGDFCAARDSSDSCINRTYPPYGNPS